MKKIIFISGVSSGIGSATALFYLELGWKVIGTYRQEKDVYEFNNKYPDQFVGYQIDLLQVTEIDHILDFLKAQRIDHIDALVNNAGVALAGPIEYQNFLEISQMIHINVLALIKLTQVLIPFLKKSNDGRIVNISSVSGHNGTPFLAGYCATKHAVEGFSESLRREMSLYGIRVVIVAPGSIQTPIWQKGFELLSKNYEKTEFKNSFAKFIAFANSEKTNALSTSAVVHDIHQAITSPNPHIRYAPIPRKWMNWYLPQLFPVRFYDYLTTKALGLRLK